MFTALAQIITTVITTFFFIKSTAQNSLIKKLRNFVLNTRSLFLLFSEDKTKTSFISGIYTLPVIQPGITDFINEEDPESQQNLSQIANNLNKYYNNNSDNNNISKNYQNNNIQYQYNSSNNSTYYKNEKENQLQNEYYQQQKNLFIDSKTDILQKMIRKSSSKKSKNIVIENNNNNNYARTSNIIIETEQELQQQELQQQYFKDSDIDYEFAENDVNIYDNNDTSDDVINNTYNNMLNNNISKNMKNSKNKSKSTKYEFLRSSNISLDSYNHFNQIIMNNGHLRKNYVNPIFLATQNSDKLMRNCHTLKCTCLKKIQQKRQKKVYYAIAKTQLSVIFEEVAY